MTGPFHKVPAVGLQPFLALPEVRQDTRDLPPEGRRVVHVEQVAQLVDDHVVQHLGRREQEEKKPAKKTAKKTTRSRKTASKK